MALNELVSLPFLVSIVITCVLVAAVSFLFYNRVQQQTIKINAIMDLMTTLVDEVNTLKVGESTLSDSNSRSNGGIYQDHLDEPSGIRGDIHTVKIGVPMPLGVDVLDPLIDVSDDEEDSDDEEHSDDEEVQDEDEDEDEHDEDEDDDEDEEDEEDEEEHSDIDKSSQDISKYGMFNGSGSRMEISIIGFDLNNNSDSIGENQDVEELSDSEVDIDVSNLNFEQFAEDNLNDGVGASELEEDIAVKGESKIIEIGEQDVTDYSKYTTSELRKIAFSRGLIGDNDKSAKNKLIKLLSQ